MFRRLNAQASIIWYTLDECTPAQLVAGEPPFFGYDLDRLQEAHGYVIDEPSGKFAKQDTMDQKERRTFSRLQLVRVHYNGQISPGWYCRMHQGKLVENGIKDLFVPLSVDVAHTVNAYFFSK